MLINCKECGREISDTVKHCPHCGAKVRKALKEKISQTNALKRFAECITNNLMLKLICVASLIGSCAIAILFLILTIISFASPYTFLNSEPCKDANNLIWDLTYRNNTSNYKIKLKDSTFYLSPGNGVTITTYTFGGEGQAQYHFKKDGTVKLYLFFNQVECDYDVTKTEVKFIKASYNYSPYQLTATDKKLANTAIELSKAVIDYALRINGKSYSFYEILSDYEDFHSSINGIKISSIVLMSVFAFTTIGITVLFALGNRKNKVIRRTDCADNIETIEETYEKGVNSCEEDEER